MVDGFFTQQKSAFYIPLQKMSLEIQVHITIMIDLKVCTW